MKSSYLSYEPMVEFISAHNLSTLINIKYSAKSRISIFLAILSTVLYRKTYNESFSVPIYLPVTNKERESSLDKDFLKKSFAFDSKTDPTLEELSNIIQFQLDSSYSEDTKIDNEIKDVVVLLSNKPFSQETEDAAKTLQQFTNSKLICIISNTNDFIEISYLQANLSGYQYIAKYLYNLANAILLNPDQCIHSFNILSSDEIEQQLSFGQGEKVSISDRPVYKDIEIFANKTPDKLAVSCGLKNLSYSELNSEANKLAHYLLKCSVTTGDIVIAFVQRSTDIIKVILAIHKVGAVYVPIDPNFPTERIMAILREVQPKFILTHSKGEEVFDNIDIPRLNLDCSSEILDSFPSKNPEINVNLDNESYIFFTSGTTGKPKGVVATHKNLVHYLSVARNKYKLNHHDKFISASRFTFSINLFKIFTPLYIGGSVRILHQDDVLNLPKLCQELQEATVFHFGPSLLKQLLPYIEQNFTDFSSFSKLKHVSSGGDMVPPEILEKLKKIFVNAEVFVIYGSSEISCMGCTYEAPRNITVEKTKVGKPHQNMSVRIFDKHGNMVPIGSPGKLYFAGDGLVKGYLNREDLTAEKFTEIEGERFYCIGDVGRFDHQGNIELLGRDDFQVQIRGMRVELPEIEYYLKRFPTIADCVIVSKILEHNTENSLIAYLVFKNNSHSSDLEIREYLHQLLPDYMIPNIFVTLDKLPTNLNGKIDRHALPIPKRGNQNQELVKPRNVVERNIADIWEDILGFEVGIDQDFTSLGGHSLQATQIISRLRDVFKVDIPVYAMLQSNHESALTNIISLAEYVTDSSKSENVRQITELQPVNHGDELPLTSYQQRIWLLAQKAGQFAVHNLPMVFQLEGNLNIPLLEESFNRVIQRHESLRTIFPLHNHGLPIQKILSQVEIKLSLEEVSIKDLDQEQISTKIDRLINQEVSKYFNLEKDPLIRVKLLKLSQDHHILIVTCHHIISDGWSLSGILLKEVSAYYKFLLGQNELELPQLTINYGDYTLWHQQEEQEKEDLLLDYWTKQLEDSIPLLSLPTDNPRPHLETYKGSIQYFEIDQHLKEKIESLAQTNGATLFMVLLAAFQVVLHRYANQKDIVIGTPIGNRTYTALENLIGCFINVVPLRSNIENNPSFLELLAQAKQVSLDAYTYPNFPVEKMLSTLKEHRDASYSPWFQVLFILLNVPSNNLELPEVTIEEKNFNKGASTFDLTFLIEQKEQGLKCSFEYNTYLYNDDTISRLIGHFKVLLESIVINPQQPVSQLPLLTESEQHQLLVEWNQTTADYPASYCIHQLFEAQVEATPDQVAVVFEEESITYEQLNRRANQLAHYLQSLGVGPEVLVGISVERSIDMIIGLLGILKAGAAYVPLDPSYPSERVEYILSNSEAPVLITSSQVLPSLPQHKAKVICLDRDWQELEQQNQDNPHSEVNGQNLSYVIYTSGSTGKPKGVQICHQSLVNFIYSMKNEPGLNSSDRLLAVTTISFDIHTLEIYLPLIVGATIVLVSRQVATDGLGLAAEMDKHDTTVMQATPATWRMLLSTNWSGKSNLKAICGGEALPQSLANSLLEKVGCLWNIYGPTETTVWSTTVEVKADREHRYADAPESIGKAIANTQIYILDEHLQPVPQGIPGELHIGGAGLARGYIKRPELTAQKFIPNPFSNQTDSRVYKTGDLVRYLADGNIEYIGRIDNQVKIRGYRIELGEIEAILLQHPQIGEGAVIVREDNPGNKRLVAYYVAKNPAPTINEIRSFIKEKLPDYMVPEAFMNLESLPLTPNGKIDRRSLPAPDITSVSQSNFVPPSNATQEQIATIWTQILDIEKIGIEDNFFELGGNSLKVTQLVFEIREAFSVELPLQTLFEYPTIAELAEVIDNQQAVTTQTSVEPLFLFHDADGEVGLYLNLTRHLDSKRPVYVLQPYGKENLPIVHTRISEMVAYYIEKIRSIQPQGPYLLGGLCAGGVLAFETACQLQAQGEEIALVALLDAPDIKVEFKQGLVAQQRWSRFSHLFQESATLNKKEKFASIGKTMFQKIVNTINYEVNHKVSQLTNNLKVRLYRYYLDKNLSVPKMLQNISVRTVYDIAVQEYFPQSLQGRVALFRATETIGVDDPAIDDTPFIEQVTDPLFGWSQRVTDGVELYDVPGGHSSCLQEPYVKVLAQQIESSIKGTFTQKAKSSERSQS